MTDAWPDIAKRFGLITSCPSHCPPGWAKHVELAITLMSRCPGWHPRAIAQVKEKFAGLRIYPEKWRDDYGMIIAGAECWCARTCESCGIEQGITTASVGGWRGYIRTLCDGCREKAEAALKR